jgi:hypothetical protein
MKLEQKVWTLLSSNHQANPVPLRSTGKMQVRYRVLFVVAFTLSLLVLPRIVGVAQRTVPVRIARWLALQQIGGSVTYQRGNSSRPAQVGDRLQAVGDGLTTGQRSNARLEVDTGVGFVNVSESTRLRIRALDYAADNGRITRIDVPQGQIRLQVRPFTHNGSELEIYTPAGVSGVRGTEFGVNVQTDGKMGVATLAGSVATAAQGETVIVPDGFQNLTIPGQPPSPPVPLRDSTELEYRVERTIRRGIRRLQLIGQVDSVNTVLVEGVPQVTDSNGQFSIQLPVRNWVRVEITVITPLGKQQVYDLSIL